MKFAHIGDLHIGKRVHDFSMLEDQIMKNQVFCDGKADTGFIENVLKIKG